MSTTILGISAYYHDSAAALIKDGKIIAAAQEERFTRIKGDSSFPHNAINYCLNTVNKKIEEIDYIVFYEEPFTKFERLLISYHTTVPKGIRSYLKSMPKWLSTNIWLENEISKELGVKKKIIFCEHHMSHAASAFYPSPYEDSAILTIDGVGEWSTTTWGIGNKNHIELKEEFNFPNSLGLLYSAFTYFTGFKINSGEYKLMGLAPYGKPKYVDLIKKELIHINEDGTVVLNQKYFSYVTTTKIVNKKFCKLFDGPPRKPEHEITQREMDIACSIQEICNECIIKMAKYIKQKSNCKNIVLAGGVALNVVSMGLLKDENIFENVWIQPAAGDAGGALGCALWFWYEKLGNKRKIDKNDLMQSSYLGPEICNESKEDDETLKKLGAKWESLDEEKLIKKVAQLLNNGKIISIARGKMEWGPRALGNRSIIGSAMDEDMQSKMNLKIKKRESFRPFAPIVLLEDVNKYFDINYESAYMLMTCHVKKEHRIKTKKNSDMLKTIKQKRSIIPAVTHVDYSSRVQTISKNRNPFIYKLLKEYKKLSGCSVLVNTSFNVRGEPIVNSVTDAYNCFMNTDIDYLIIGNRLLDKSKQSKKKSKKVKFQLD